MSGVRPDTPPFPPLTQLHAMRHNGILKGWEDIGMSAKRTVLAQNESAPYYIRAVHEFPETGPPRWR